MNAIRRGLALSVFAVGVTAFGFADAQTKTYTVNADFDGGSLTNVCHGPGAKSVCADPTPDQLVLGRTPVSKADRVWADNYISGWVIGLDVKTGNQISRFPSGLISINGNPTGAQGSVKEGGKPCDFATQGDCPGRVTTDTNGDVWIINRGFGQQGTLSKFTTNKQHCIDRNGDGVIQTSVDANGDGVINPDDPKEYFGQGDECILNTISIGANKDLPRAVAVDKKGKIWVSTWSGQKVYRINPNDPIAIELTIDLKAFPATAGVNPYSMASGGNYIFVSNSSGATVRINIDYEKNPAAPDAIMTAPCAGTYGVVGDPSGGWAWLGGWFANPPGLRKADFTTSPPTCPTYSMNGNNVTAVTLDDAGVVWVDAYSANLVYRVNQAGVILSQHPGGQNPHGLSVDFFGNVWGIFHAPPYIKAFQPSGADLVLPTLPKLTAPPGYNYDPYLYSDFTGTQIDRQAPYTRVGTWSGTYDVGAKQVPWQKVVWNTEPQGATPAETTINASVRAADDLPTLGTSGYTPVTSGAAIANVKGRFVEVKVDLTGPGYLTPVLSDITVVGPCMVIGDACCLQDSDCLSQNACDNPTCPVPGGKCQHAPKPSCCLKDADCNDNNLCTKDSCPVPGGVCANAKIPGCCNNNSDCDDGMPCTADLCSGPGGTCSHQTIFGCCTNDKDCTKGSLCSAATCPVVGGLCKFGSKPGCCTTDKDCDDGDLCNVHKCDPNTKACAPNTHIPGCCNTDMDCADADACTADSCSGKGGTCKHSVIPMCCSAMSPEVGKPCDVPKAPNDQPPCKPGKAVCVMGVLQCQGGVGPNSEVCNGVDDNCDGTVDGPGSCANGLICVSGNCAGPCKGGEFPCDPGLTCVNDLCVPTACAMVSCMPGTVCDPKTGACVMAMGGTGGAGGAMGTGGGAATGGAAGAAGKAGSAGATAMGTGGKAGSSAGVGGSTTATGGTTATTTGVGGASAAAGSGAGGKAGGSTGTGGAPTTGGAAAPTDSSQKGGCGCEVPGGEKRGDRTAALGLLVLLGAAVRLRGRRRAEHTS